MPVIEVTSEAAFRKHVGKGLVVCDWFATWCGPCEAVAPRIEALSTKYPNVTFIKVDVDKLSGLSETYSVTAMPTFTFFSKGAEIDKVVGANVSEVEKKIHQNATRAGTGAFGGTGRTLNGSVVTGSTTSTGSIGSQLSSTNIFIIISVLFLIYEIYSKYK